MIIRRTRQRTCECGCGAPVGKRTDGKPKRFVFGHHAYGVDRRKHTVTTGESFGYLSVKVPRVEGPRNSALCVCICGEERIVTVHRLVTGHTRSCGSCLAAERSTKHGLSVKGNWHPLYAVWSSMKQRVLNPRNKAYPNYGGRGIQICDRWLDFQLFYEDVAPTWSPGLTLDRTNNDGHYEPSNFRWATWVEQNNNRRPAVRKAI